MKQVGEILSGFFNKTTIEKAQGYLDLFSCWAVITEKNGIPAAASHSRIVELEKAVLQIEADHPGWIQLLQTKQAYLLNTVIRRFPDLEIRGISFRLSRDPLALSAGLQAGRAPGAAAEERPQEEQTARQNAVISVPEAITARDGNRDYFDRIEDTAFLETLKRLEKLERRGRPRKKD